MLSEQTKARFDRELAKYPPDQKQSAVMACLAVLQQERGWISPESEQEVADYLGMAPIAVREVVMKLLPFSENGQALGTGAYVLVLNVDAEGKEITKNAAGESIVVKSGHKEYVRRFGYLRAH